MWPFRNEDEVFLRKTGETAAAVEEASEERPGLQRKLDNPDIFRQVCTQCVCTLPSRYLVVCALDTSLVTGLSLLRQRKLGVKVLSHSAIAYVRGPMNKTPSPPSPPCLPAPEVGEKHLINIK